MLRSGLEDRRYNSQVALAKLDALCMDAPKATVPCPDILQKITGTMST